MQRNKLSLHMYTSLQRCCWNKESNSNLINLIGGEETWFALKPGSPDCQNLTGSAVCLTWSFDPTEGHNCFSQIMALQPFRLKRCSGLLLQCAQKRCMNLAFGQFLCTSFQVLYQPVIKTLTAVWLENYWTQEMGLPIAWPSLFCSPFEP